MFLVSTSAKESCQQIGKFLSFCLIRNRESAISCAEIMRGICNLLKGGVSRNSAKLGNYKTPRIGKTEED